MLDSAIINNWVTQEPVIFPKGIQYWLPCLTFVAPTRQKQANKKLKILLNKMADCFDQHVYLFWGGGLQHLRSVKYDLGARAYHYHAYIGFEGCGVDKDKLNRFLQDNWDGDVDPVMDFKLMDSAYKINASSYVTQKHSDYNLTIGHHWNRRACQKGRCGHWN